jgi:hypothetical protein
MALNQIQMMAPRPEPVRQEKEKKSDIEKIMEGVNLASGILGIAVNVQQIRNQQGQIEGNELKNATLEDQRQGIGTLADKADLAKSMEPVAIGTPGATTHRFRGQGGQVEELGLRIPQKAGAPIETTKVDRYDPRTGQTFTDIVENKPGQSFIQPPKRDIQAEGFKKTEIGKAAQSAGDKLFDDVRPHREALDAAGEAETLLEMAKTNPAAAAPALRKMARASGEKGVLSDADAKAYGGSQAIADRFLRMAEQAESGTLPAEDVAFAVQVTQTMRARSEQAVGQIVDSSVSRFSKNFQVPPEQAYEMLTGGARKDPAAQTAAGQGGATAKPGVAYGASDASAGPSLSDIDKELKRRGVKTSGASGGF